MLEMEDKTVLRILTPNQEKRIKTTRGLRLVLWYLRGPVLQLG